MLSFGFSRTQCASLFINLGNTGDTVRGICSTGVVEEFIP
jgi:hypothetical protein